MSQLNNLEIVSFEILRIIFFLSFLFYIISMISRKNKIISFISTVFFVLGFLSLTFNLSVRTVAAGRAPFSNLYESLMSFVWGLVLIYLIIEKSYKLNVLGIFASGITMVAVLYASVLPKEIEPLIPALKSHWLVFHVLCFVFAYGAFAISFAAGIYYLILERIKKDSEEKKKLLVTVEEVIYKVIAFSFPWMTLGIITGAIWANNAWGTYWSWDPKETWSLITWLVYAAFLHARYNYKWKGTVTAILAITGFAVVMFTYLGVNFLLAGLHSYAK